MADRADFKINNAPNAVSRRNFIKGVITSGMAVSSANYLFRALLSCRASSSLPA